MGGGAIVPNTNKRAGWKKKDFWQLLSLTFNGSMLSTKYPFLLLQSSFSSWSEGTTRRAGNTVGIPCQTVLFEVADVPVRHFIGNPFALFSFRKWLHQCTQGDKHFREVCIWLIFPKKEKKKKRIVCITGSTIFIVYFSLNCISVSLLLFWGTPAV